MLKTIRVATRALGLCTVLALFAVAGLSYGQSNDASLSGTVTDTTNAAIPNASLILTDEATGLSRAAKSDATGEFNITSISPGKYDLTVSAPGFKTTINKGIQLMINQAGRVNVQLPLGQTHQTVTVQGGASTINVTNATLGGGIAPETLQDFPLIISGAPRSS
ncbi:MAG: carboxypeptidase-like regulatory domain-containing protein, partial [Silvibacterium sp.]